MEAKREEVIYACVKVRWLHTRRRTQSDVDVSFSNLFGAGKIENKPVHKTGHEQMSCCTEQLKSSFHVRMREIFYIDGFRCI